MDIFHHLKRRQITELKKHLQQPRKVGRARPRLQDVDKTIPEAAWSILRWCVASCTAHLEQLQSEDEQVKNIGTSTPFIGSDHHY